ncbi:hypothetical protein Ddc_11442 [Ditylenchus destructor]|nr:hypothetical protein Ddc_11442 [Ditylenchus destructor]
MVAIAIKITDLFQLIPHCMLSCLAFFCPLPICLQTSTPLFIHHSSSSDPKAIQAGVKIKTVQIVPTTSQLHPTVPGRDPGPPAPAPPAQ